LTDRGSLCNYTGNGSAWCNINNDTNYCPTQDGINCYAPWEGLYMTYDSVTTSPIKDDENGSYCYSLDGDYCYSNYGLDCDLKTGYLCTTRD
jgi:hypothetical protein